MKHSNHGWNNTFHHWIREVKRAKNDYKHLLKRLEYFKIQLTSLKGISYDETSTSASNVFTDKSFYWLSKIEEVEDKITAVTKVISEFETFVLTLTSQEQKVIKEVFIESNSITSTAKEMRVSRNRIYEIINSIIRKRQTIKN